MKCLERQQIVVASSLSRLSVEHCRALLSLLRSTLDRVVVKLYLIDEDALCGCALSAGSKISKGSPKAAPIRC